MKKCNMCKTYKDKQEFNKNKAVCRSCQSIRRRRYYEENKARGGKRSLNQREKFNIIMKEIKNPLYCEHCGEDDNIVLDFHHNTQNDKNFGISKFINKSAPTEKNIKILKEEIEKCTVLCANCHRREHYKQRNN